MKEWREVKLGDIADIDSGFPFKSKEYTSKGNLRVVRGKNVTVGMIRWGHDTKFWDYPTNNLRHYLLAENDVVIGMDGSKVGENCSEINKVDLPAILAQRVGRVRAKNSSYQKFIWYCIKNKNFIEYIKAIHTGTSIPHISQKQISDFQVLLPPLPEQKAIAEVLSSLDDKIDLLHRQNKTLEQMAETLFRQWFIEEAEEGWEERKLGDILDISIGRTPPRKENKWFSKRNTDIKWISIKDLGNQGIFVMDTSEYLTKDAVNKFNIPIIPENTVVLSFKMTVGRVGITTEEMLSNEAIAQFKFEEKTPITKEYLYLFLKNFKYDTLGSTSSIVTSINSQMIKEMSIVIPNGSNILSKFKTNTESYFNKIKQNQIQIHTLEKLRDTLLPKLMSGDVRVKID